MDNILLLVFGTLAVIGTSFGILSFWFSLKAAKRPNGELAMVMWGFGSLAGFVLAGMSLAYFILPIFFFHLTH